MMTQSIPASVEELNLQQSYNKSFLSKKSDFEDISVEKRLKREVSLPNGVENWNIGNFDPYLNFDENFLENAVINSFDVLASPEDRLVPESDLRDRSSSISSITSSFEEKPLSFHNFGVKTINTISMDSGSTCISSDHTYFGSGSLLNRSLDPEETYQNLDVFLQQVPELPPSEVLNSSSFSPMPSTNSNDSFELTVLESISSMNDTSLSNDQHSNFSVQPSTSKRSLDTIAEEDLFSFKIPKYEIGEPKYHEIRRKNNIASKNCRKTRKEKQKDMELKVVELEKERSHLRIQVKVLEELIEAHKKRLLEAIAQKR